MKRRTMWAGALALSLIAGKAIAGETPLYQPAPGWVVPAALPKSAGDGTASPSLLIFDFQQRAEGSRLWSYQDTAVRASTPEILSQMATVALQWLPDKGDLIIHEASIVRGAETIDLLAAGQKFETLRREESLEQRELTGLLTATTVIEGLRVGDILRMRYSTTSKDSALAGRVQSVMAVPAAPVRLGSGRMRILWPTGSEPRWHLLASGISAVPRRNGKDMELLIPLPLPKQPEMPDDAPVRFKRPPLLELTTFTSWPEVSQVMAPLYATEGLIPANSPLAAEVAEIAAAEPDPLKRAQRALELVQDKIRYFAVAMNGGNYMPQKPLDTWRLRYGDCKAKTLLLLALLDAMDIKAEPVLASISLGDFVSERIPSAAAFDHVLVRAEIGGRELWLDGTGSGSRLEDIYDTPGFRNVLPLRATGAELLKVAMHPNARPNIDIAVDADESTSVDLPSVFDATVVLRGPVATAFGLAAGNLDGDQQKQLIKGFFTRTLGDAQFSDMSLKTEPANATATLTTHGVGGSPWKRKDRQRERRLGVVLGELNFAPDRSKAEWNSVPVATPNPQAAHYRLRLRLPDGGKGYVLQGTKAEKQNLAGYVLDRSIDLKGGVLTLDERLDSTGAEIPVTQLATERDAVATAKSRQPKLIAPANATLRWNLADAAPGSTQLANVRLGYDKAIAENAREAPPYLNRANFRYGIGEFKGALADLTKALSLSATKEAYLQRSAVNRALGDLDAALADARKARELDPSMAGAQIFMAKLMVERGNLKEGLAVLDERIALGGDSVDGYLEAKAGLLGEFGDPAEALALVDQLIEKKPGNAALVNTRCWIKGTRAIQIDTAVKDCTSAIELSSESFAALDSRAMVWFRLGRYDDALRDLNAALEEVPGMAPSRYMRGVILARLNRAA